MGSFVDGEDMEGNTLGEGDDSAMSGLGYDNGEEEELRRQSMPSMNAQPAGSDVYGAHSRTYPPAIPRPTGSGLYPPNVDQAQVNSTGSSSLPNSMASSHTPNTSVSSAAVVGTSTGMYSQTGMTESPKPLSPGISGHDASNTNRQRSPGLSQQLQQQQLNRRQSGLQSPHSNHAQTKLPGLSHPSGFSGPGSAGFSHGRTPSGPQPTNDGRNVLAQSDPSVWAYIQSMEEKMKTLTEKVTSLEHEVASLRQNRDTRDGEVALVASTTTSSVVAREDQA
jgi:hypothetical protein